MTPTQLRQEQTLRTSDEDDYEQSRNGSLLRLHCEGNESGREDKESGGSAIGWQEQKSQHHHADNVEDPPGLLQKKESQVKK